MNTVIFTGNEAVDKALEQYNNGADPSKLLLAERDAHELLPCKQATLRKARWSGSLLGQPAPDYVKLGRIVRYRLSDLLEWRDSVVQVHSHTASSAEVVNAQ